MVSEHRSHLPMLGAREAGRLRTDDYHQTPECATEALLLAEKFYGVIWEPCCGEGAISRVLERHGYKVISTDLVDRGYGQGRIDFLMEYEPRTPNVITNCPFKLSTEFAYKACELTTGKVAMLCRIGWLEGSARRKMFESLPLARVHIFSKRLPFMHRDEFVGQKSQSNAIGFAWFVFDHNKFEKTVIDWI